MINYYDKYLELQNRIMSLEDDIKKFGTKPTNENRNDLYEDIKLMRIKLNELQFTLKNLYLGGGKY